MPECDRPKANASPLIIFPAAFALYNSVLMRQQFSHFLRRFPWVGKQVVRTYRMTQPRYTAGVIGVLLDDQDRVLLVEHVFHFGSPWGLPGGWMGRAEHPARAIERELREETKLEVKAQQPIMIQNSHFWGAHLDIAFLLTTDSPLDKLTLSNELISYGWYALDNLPPLKDFHLAVLAEMQKNNAK